MNADTIDPVPEQDATSMAQPEQDATEQPDVEPQTFTADYVSELRAEAAQHRTRAKALAAELVAAWAAADGRLVDPTDLPSSAVDITDDGTVTRDTVTAAIDALVKSKPHLAAQRPAPLPQGARPQAQQVSLLNLLNAR
jgi:hypothetical protein